jgi:hypothetical protein
LEHPSEDEVQAMSNREFAELIRSQAELIDRLINRQIHPSSPLLGPGDRWA